MPCFSVDRLCGPLGLPDSSVVKINLPELQVMQEMWVPSLDWEDLLEEEMATHSSILAWEISIDRGAWGYSPWGHKESDKTEQLTLSFIWSYLEILPHILSLNFILLI